MCRNIIKQIAYSSLLVSQLWASCSAESLQIGTMYAERIQGVGLYLGLEAENIIAHASGYLDATLLISSAYDAQEPIFGGVSVGLRTALDLPLSPYMGVGVYIGQNEKEVLAASDGLDNDGDGFKDDVGENKIDNILMSAVYPELGWRLAVGDSFSLRVMSRYMVSSFVRHHDDWFFGVSLAFSQ